MSLSHYQGDLSVAGYVGRGTGAGRDQLDITRRVGADTYRQSSINPNDGNTFGTNLSVDWDVNDKQRLGISGQYWRGLKDQIQQSRTFIDYGTDGQVDVGLITDNVRDGFWRYIALNPYYSLTFDTSNHKLDVDVNIYESLAETTNLLTTRDLIVEDGFFPGQSFDQPGNTKIRAAKLDYSKPLSRQWQLNIGGKYSFAQLDNNLSVFREPVAGNWEKDLNQSNHFVFEETISAGYVKLSGTFGNWSTTLGLRYENSYSKGRSITIDQTIDRRIAQLFPSFSLQRKITDQFSASVAYSYRIDRPGYFSLNPFTTSLDPFTSMRGNPILIPAFTHSGKFNLIYENYPFFSLEYKVVNDPMVEVTEQNDDTGETFLNTVNLANQRLFNAQLLFPLDLTSFYFWLWGHYCQFQSI